MMPFRRRKRTRSDRFHRLEALFPAQSCIRMHNSGHRWFTCRHPRTSRNDGQFGTNRRPLPRTMPVNCLMISVNALLENEPGTFRCGLEWLWNTRGYQRLCRPCQEGESE
jgi:hypothetical protein